MYHYLIHLSTGVSVSFLCKTSKDFVNVEKDINEIDHKGNYRCFKGSEIVYMIVSPKMSDAEILEYEKAVTTQKT